MMDYALQIIAVAVGVLIGASIPLAEIHQVHPMVPSAFLLLVSIVIGLMFRVPTY